MAIGVCVYILYGHRAIFLWAFSDGLVQNHRETARNLYGNPVVIVQSPQPRIEITRISYDAHASVRRLRGDHTVLCDYRVVLGIRVPNVYNFSFLIELTPKTKCGKGMRSKKVKDDLSQGGRTVMVRLP